MLTKHYSPAPSEVMQRFRFNTRTRREGELVAEFVADLRRLAEFCNFGATLEKMLRDRLVCGIQDEPIQKKLLAEKALTFEAALSIAQGSEAATKNLKEMQSPVTPITVKQEPVHKVDGGKRNLDAKELTCHRCGTPGHSAPQCRFKDRVCHKCKKKGHLAKVCRSRKPKEQPETPRRKKRPHSTVRRVGEESEDETDESASDADIYAVSQKGKSLPPLKVQVEVDGRRVSMEVDTGASMSIMSETTYKQLWSGRALDPSEIRLQSYSKEVIPVVGSTQTKVVYEGQTALLPLVIVKSEGPTLLGSNWLHHIRLNWNQIHYALRPGLQEVLHKYQSIFQGGLGNMKGFEATLEVDPEAIPRFCKARTVPYSMRDKVEDELNRLVKEGILEPVDYSDWAAPIVAVLKSDKKSVRICGDFRMTVNPISKLNRYPLPKVEDIFAMLKKGKAFTKLDLSQAYQQISLNANSRKFVVINTHKGLFRYTRLPYGIASAPGIFQKAMEQLLQGIAGIAVYIDDILVTGGDEDEHLKSLEEVLKRLQEAGLQVKKHKCQFLAPSVSYLGHVIDSSGLHPGGN